MKLTFALLFVSSIALADVGPRPPQCNVPDGCVTCLTEFGNRDAGDACRAEALDAGLIESECSDRLGASATSNFCPPGKVATRGCSSVGVLGLSALAVLLFRRRR
jgi:uncharacterized protein (TIGR03382 family)